MDDCCNEPCDCGCDCGVSPSGFAITIGRVTAECEFDQCGDGDLVVASDFAPLPPIDPFDQVLNAVMQSFAHLGPGVRRVVISEPTPDGPITYLERSRDGDDTPPSMAETTGE